MAVFIVTYNPSRWSWGAQRSQWERRTAAGRAVTGRWSVGSRKSGIVAGQDRAFLLRQGPHPRGIIGSGTFRSGSYQDEHWDEERPGELANYADIRWDRIVPDEDLLPVAVLDAQVPGLPWLSGLQGSGALLPAPGDAVLERLWAQHVGAGPSPGSDEDEGGSRGAGQRWQDDPVRRRAVEDHAQRLLEEHYRAQGWTVEDVRRHSSFDALATKGGQVRYLEAKGTETDGRSVLVTPKEVDFATGHPGQCVLGIVAGVRFREDGRLDEASGELEVLDWDPSAGTLSPTGYSFTPRRGRRRARP